MTTHLKPDWTENGIVRPRVTREQMLAEVRQAKEELAAIYCNPAVVRNQAIACNVFNLLGYLDHFETVIKSDAAQIKTLQQQRAKLAQALVRERERARKLEEESRDRDK